jgi:hypothetical protein
LVFLLFLYKEKVREFAFSPGLSIGSSSGPLQDRQLGFAPKERPKCLVFGCKVSKNAKNSIFALVGCLKDARYLTLKFAPKTPIFASFSYTAISNQVVLKNTTVATIP